MTARPPESGVILISVLVALALGAALVTLMLVSQDAAIDRARRASAAAQAQALALGAETSVLVALRRDMAEAPEADALSEPWAQAAQAEVELEMGRFAVTLHDAQGGLDLNGLTDAGPAKTEPLRRLVAALDLPPATADLILDAVRNGPLQRLDQVEGLDDLARAALAPHLVLLPVPGTVNLNSADPLLMAVLLGNLTAARRLVALRERNGAVTRQDLLDLGLVPPGGVGFTSDVWDVEALAEVDGVEARLRSRLVRRRAPGLSEVVVATRRFGARGDGALPPLP